MMTFVTKTESFSGVVVDNNAGWAHIKNNNHNVVVSTFDVTLKKGNKVLIRGVVDERGPMLEEACGRYGLLKSDAADWKHVKLKSAEIIYSRESGAPETLLSSLDNKPSSHDSSPLKVGACFRNPRNGTVVKLVSPFQKNGEEHWLIRVIYITGRSRQRKSLSSKTILQSYESHHDITSVLS